MRDIIILYKSGDMFMNKQKYNNNLQSILILNLIIFSANILMVTLYNLKSLITFFYVLLLVVVFNQLLFKLSYKKLFLAFNISTFIMMILFFLHLNEFPNYYGLTPSIRGVGADDGFFYSQATNNFPAYFPVHHRVNFDNHSFSTFLIVLTIPIRYIYNLLPLDFLLLNIISSSFLPVLSSYVAWLWTQNKKIMRHVFLLTLLCPLVIANGLILIRDGWTAMLLIAGLYFFSKKKYLKLTLIFAIQFFLRIASGFQMIVVISIYVFFISISKKYFDNRLKSFSKIILVLIPIVLGVSVFLARDYISLKLGSDLFFREEFAETFIGNSDGSVLNRINQFPFIIRVPIATIFFVLAPFISLDFNYLGYFIPRNVLTTIFGVLNIFYIRYFINSMFASFKLDNKWIRITIYTFVFLMMLISQMSMQVRHKTMFMPIYYIIVGYGMYNSTYKSRMLGYLISAALIAANIVILL